MNYNVVQVAVTKGTYESNPDGVLTKVGNDKYTLEDATAKWHTTCVALKNDADTYKYKCAVIDSQLNIVDTLVEFRDKGTMPQPTPPEPEPQPETELEGE